MIRALTVIFLFFLSQQLFAGSINLVINGKAMHEGTKSYNENNWGLGVEYNFKERRKWTRFLNGGFFKDSNSNNSNYIGGGSKRRFLLTDDKDGWHIDAGMTAFIMTRVNYKNNKPFLGVLPYLSVGTGRVAINATYIPSVSPKFVGLLFFQASFRISEW